MADRDEAFIAGLSEPERVLGAWLASKLDEDDWNKTERMLLAALRQAREEGCRSWRHIDHLQVEPTQEQREIARNHPMYNRGDMILVWINEGTIGFMPTAPGDDK